MEMVGEMAGDWIKFETATLDKPEVCQIADAADIDVDAVIGKLLRVWSWFDEQTSDSNAPSVSKMLLDRLVGVKGFCKHMIDVGWLSDDGSKISIPNFERHNGKTAKTRLLTNRRVANHYANTNVEPNDATVSKALTKEDVDIDKDQKPLKAPLTPKGEKTDSPEFLIFWKLYPKKKSRKDAVRAWAKIKPSQIPMVMDSLALHVVSHDWLKNNGQYVPLAASWLNGEKFYDEVITYEQSTNRQGGGPAGISLVDQVRNRGAERAAERARAAGQDPSQSAELFATGLASGGNDFEGDFSRIRDSDGKIMGVDD